MTEASIGALAILGLIQGITEFLPISSSGHLIIVRELFGISTEYGLGVDAILQLATVLAVIVYFRKDIWQIIRSTLLWIFRKGVPREEIRFVLALLIGTLPAAVIGYFLEPLMDTMFRSALLVAWTLIAGSGLFVIAEYLSARYRERVSITPIKGLIIGIFQCLALIPGVSRSGSTISAGLLLGLSREEAARFGFLLSIPILLGAGLKKFLELGKIGYLEAQWLPILAGAVVSFVTGMLVIHYLLKFLRSHTLMTFVLYRIILAIIIFVAVF